MYKGIYHILSICIFSFLGFCVRVGAFISVGVLTGGIFLFLGDWLGWDIGHARGGNTIPTCDDLERAWERTYTLFSANSLSIGACVKRNHRIVARQLTRENKPVSIRIPLVRGFVLLISVFVCVVIYDIFT